MSNGNSNGNGRTYNDPVKQIARDKIREFIEKHYRNRGTSKLKVLCFPGAEAEGEEALEVKQVYDRLGIPRQNIVGLECDRKKAERLQRANLGIEVVCMEDWRYLQTTDRRFDVMSLDYTGYFGKMQNYVLDLIASKRLLENRGVLATNYYGAREGKTLGDDLRLINDYFNLDIGAVSFVENGEKIIEQLATRKSELKDSRSNAIQLCVIGSLFLGYAALDPYRLAMGKPDAVKLVDESLKILSKDEKIQDYIYGISSDETAARTLEFRNACVGNLIKTSFLGFKRNGFSNKEAVDLAYYLLMWRARPYFLTNHESYSYVSNKGSPMLMDLWFTDTLEQRIRRDFFEIVGKGGISILPGVNGRKRYERFDKAYKFVDETLPLISSNNVSTERVFLGSSYQPRQIVSEVESDGGEVISKEDAIDLLASGIPAKEIAEAFSGFSERQLAAFKAHITMGTYDEKDRNGGIE